MITMLQNSLFYDFAIGVACQVAIQASYNAVVDFRHAQYFLSGEELGDDGCDGRRVLKSRIRNF